MRPCPSGTSSHRGEPATQPRAALASSLPCPSTSRHTLANLLLLLFVLLLNALVPTPLLGGCLLSCHAASKADSLCTINAHMMSTCDSTLRTSVSSLGMGKLDSLPLLVEMVSALLRSR